MQLAFQGATGLVREHCLRQYSTAVPTLQGTTTKASIISKGTYIPLGKCLCSLSTGGAGAPAFLLYTMLASGLEGTKKPRATGTDTESHFHCYTENPHKKHLKGLDSMRDKGCGTMAALRKPLETLVKYHTVSLSTDSGENLI